MIAIRPVRLSVSSPIHGTWTGRIEDRYPYNAVERGDIKFRAWARCYSMDDGKDFTWMTVEADPDSDDIGSPQLWKNSGSTVTQYQQEMKDMDRDSADSDYEPSLKDIVLPSPIKEMKSPMQNRLRRGKEPERPAKKYSRTESMDHGVFRLKIFSPFPSGPRRNSTTGKASSKLWSKPELTDEGKVEKIGQNHKFGSKDNHNIIVPYKRRMWDRLRTFIFRKSYPSYHDRKLYGLGMV